MPSRFLIPLMLLVSPVAAQQTADPDSGYEIQRKSIVAPSYPRKALADSREGWVDLKFIINPDGSIQKVSVVAAEPRRVFERAALRAANKWTFEAPADSGLNTPQEGVIRVHFSLQD